MKPYIKRLPVNFSYRDDVLLYGADNLYPQRVEAVVERSPITKSAIVVTADFINGFGFQQNGEFSLGEYDANELLAKVSKDWSMYNSLGLIFDITMTGQIAEVKYIDFKYIRLGIPKKGTNEIVTPR